MRFSLRDLVWLTIVLTLAFGWSVDMIDTASDTGGASVNAPKTIVSWVVGLFY